jgi:hypothetical protein
MLLAGIALAQTPVRTRAACTLEIVQKLDLSCSPDQPCPLFLELTDAELVGERVILAGNIHTSSSTLESVLLVSDDAGRTWTEAHARIPGGALAAIQFLDFETGWISGHILHPDARDPFMLITSDGGKTWRRRAVYSEPKTGAIDHFRFTSRTSGMMAVDRGRAGENGLRYELWESNTGGASWSIRQVDARPIPFPGGERTATKPVRIPRGRRFRRATNRAAGGWPVASLGLLRCPFGRMQARGPGVERSKNRPSRQKPPASVAPSKPAGPPPSLRKGKRG